MVYILKLLNKWDANVYNFMSVFQSMEEWQKAWLAAAIDGDGSISINKYPRKRKDGTQGLFVKIGVYNAYEDFCRRAFELVGAGGVTERKGMKGRRHYVFSCSGASDVKKVLMDIQPYLIVKAKNAELVLKFIDEKERGVVEESKYIDSTESLKKAKDGGGARHHLKGWRGSSEAHRAAALHAKNNHLKGWRGDPEGHSNIGKRKGTDYDL